MSTIWRLNIKSDACEGIDPRMFCIKNQILGVGWGVDIEGVVDWDAYMARGETIYYKTGDKGWWPALNAIKNRMKINDLCWTRDLDGLYYLGRIVGEWAYQGNAEYRAADILNIRACVWKKVGEVDVVPGKVVNSFIPNRTVQAVDDESVRIYSQFLYNKNSEQLFYTLSPVATDLFSLISAEDCEDLVGIFLQEMGYRLISSSCRADTAAYEFVLKHSETGRAAVAQVKQGCVDLNVDDYLALPSEVYLFTTRGRYLGTPSESVFCIDPNELKEFAFIKRHLMSERIKTWMAIAEELGQTAG